MGVGWETHRERQFVEGVTTSDVANAENGADSAENLAVKLLCSLHRRVNSHGELHPTIKTGDQATKPREDPGY